MWKKVVFSLAFGCAVQLALAQGYANNWVIADGSGLNFSTGSPLFFSSKVHANIPYYATSQIASVSDKQGNLLFYVSQDSVYTKNHQPMINGYGLYYLKNPTRKSNTYIIPHPAQPLRYYIIYTINDNGTGIGRGVYYSIVDMSNGVGQIVSKNNQLSSSQVAVNDQFISAIYNDYKKNYEIFYTTQGNSNNPGLRTVTIDSIGIHVNTNAIQPIFGSFRFNTQGTMAARYYYNPGSLNTKIIELLQYDKQTGLFSVLKRFASNEANYIWDMIFSPSGRYLYATTTTADPSNPNGFKSRMFRWDLYQPDTTAIKNSRVNIATSNYPLSCKSFYSMMQLAPNQKVYATIEVTSFPSCQTYIAELAQPDSLYPGNLNPTAISAQGKRTWALPSFVLNWLERPPFTLSHACQDSVLFDLTFKNIVDSVYWDFGDPASGAANHSNLLSPIHHYSAYGGYWVQVVTCWDGQCDTLADSIFVEPVPKFHLPNDTLLCAGESVAINIGQGFNANYLWNTGSTDSTAVLSKTGQYIVTAYNNCGSHTDTINIAVIEPPKTQLRDTIVCDYYQVDLHVLADSATYLWNTGDTTNIIYPTANGTYSVDIENPCGFVKDQAFVEYKKCICKVWLANTFTPNNDGKNDIYKPIADCENFSFNMLIFNRWGDLVAELNENTDGWDGTINGQMAPIGVYTYKIYYTGLQNENPIKKEQVGMLTLTR